MEEKEVLRIDWLVGEKRVSDEEVVFDSDNEYLPEVQPFAQESDSAEEDNFPVENDISGVYIPVTYFFPLH